jgi:SAM-dependent methyltransferase
MTGELDNGDPYADGTHRWWSLSRPSPELISAIEDGWLAPPGRVLDLGCGLATEAAYLSEVGFAGFGVDLSHVALQRARALHPKVDLVRGDVRSLPFGAQSFDFILDRGTFHYLDAPGREGYVREVGRVLRVGGRFLLRACLYSAGKRNQLEERSVTNAFAGWQIDDLTRQAVPSDTRTMPALVLRLRKS